VLSSVAVNSGELAGLTSWGTTKEEQPAKNTINNKEIEIQK
jgi:hypothetical protein